MFQKIGKGSGNIYCTTFDIWKFLFAHILRLTVVKVNQSHIFRKDIVKMIPSNQRYCTRKYKFPFRMSVKINKAF